jgi:hypothetical protein
MPTPDCETSMMRQVMLIPAGIARRLTGLSGRDKRRGSDLIPD